MSGVVVFDLEATCWDDGTHPKEEMETIEIGAVRLDQDLVPTGDEFCTFVRPIRHPLLSDFCSSLTTIQQSDVDPAPGFPQAMAAFLDWAQPQRLPSLCTWGDYDITQLRRDFRLHRMAELPWFSGGEPRHVNVRREYADRYNNGQLCPIPMALDRLGLSFDGTLHRGIDDARNIAAVLAAMRSRSD